MSVVEHAGLDTIPLLAVNGIGFASNMIIDTRRGHEVALISRIDKHFARVGMTADHGHAGDACADLPHSVRAIEPFIAMHFDAVFLNVILKNLLGDVRLENPHGALLAVNRRSALAFVSIRLAFLPFPRRGLLVMLPNAMIKLTAKPANHSLV